MTLMDTNLHCKPSEMEGTRDLLLAIVMYIIFNMGEHMSLLHHIIVYWTAEQNYSQSYCVIDLPDRSSVLFLE